MSARRVQPSDSIPRRKARNHGFVWRLEPYEILTGSKSGVSEQSVLVMALKLMAVQLAAKFWGITATIVTGANAATFLACRTERNALRMRVGPESKTGGLYRQWM